MGEVKDIVERLREEANIEITLHNTLHSGNNDELLFEAAREIEELRSLIDAMKENR